MAMWSTPLNYDGMKSNVDIDRVVVHYTLDYHNDCQHSNYDDGSGTVGLLNGRCRWGWSVYSPKTDYTDGFFWTPTTDPNMGNTDLTENRQCRFIRSGVNLGKIDPELIKKRDDKYNVSTEAIRGSKVEIENHSGSIHRQSNCFAKSPGGEEEESKRYDLNRMLESRRPPETQGG
ncbi:hypothetical protein CCACVL1_19065 [Corchorus capsularis]|uniref:Uncharacterized protein n=1 Tax=Corchorus capsularis TaxID=210143 RepID=A0A1R3HIP5_COCAP|nr:hypothetical protein CCACVL1_19065 [Corchorus capsularis]